MERNPSVSTLVFNLMEAARMNDINLRQAVRYAVNDRMILLPGKELLHGRTP